VNGLIWHSTPRATVGLVVSGGVVISAPPYARRWALGRPAEELLNDPRADTAWIPEEAQPPVTWTKQDLTALRLLNEGVGPIRVLSTEENRMTESAPEQDESMWDGEEGAPAPGQSSYPELPDNPHNHVYTWSPKLPDGSMLVIRANTADALVAATEAMAPLAGRLRAAWQQVTGGPAPAPQAPAPAPFPAQQGVNYNPQMPPPNQPYPGQPAWQQAGAPQAPQQQWNGGGQQAAGNRQGPKPRPDWPQVYKINVPFPAKDAFKSFREANKDALKGKVAWAGGGDYWVHGDVVAGFTSYNLSPRSAASDLMALRAIDWRHPALFVYREPSEDRWSFVTLGLSSPELGEVD
jgi:hypothetical protein